MISSLFRYQTKCANNVVTAVTAARKGDISALSAVRDDLAKETVTGLGKIGLRVAGGWLVETLASDTPVESAVSLISTICDSKLNLLTVAVNGVATFAASTVVAANELRQIGENYHRYQTVIS